MPKKKSCVFYTVRLPTDLHEPLKAEAEHNERSLAREIIKRLRQTLPAEPIRKGAK